VWRQALSVGVASGAYGVSFGALATASGLSAAQACALSVLMFTGGSQFALVGVLGAGGSGLAGAASAVLLAPATACTRCRSHPCWGCAGCAGCWRRS